MIVAIISASPLKFLCQRHTWSDYLALAKLNRVIRFLFSTNLCKELIDVMNNFNGLP